MHYICGANQWTGFYMITASVMKGLTVVKVLRCYKKCLFLMEFLIVFRWYFSHNYLQLVYFQGKNYVHMWCPFSSLKLLIDFGLNVSFKNFDNFKNKQKSVWSNVFWYVKLCIFWKCVQHNIIEIKHKY